jgi:hypothetical protein
MSSTKAPSFWVPQSLAYVIETSTCWPAYAPRLTDHCFQPPEFPEAAFHAPLVPVAVQVPPVSVW